MSIRKIQWEKIRQSESIHPTPAFKEELRATLYENAGVEHRMRFEKVLNKIQSPKSSLELQFSSSKNIHSISSLSNIFSFSSFFHFIHSFKRWVFMIGGGALAMLMIIPMFSIFTSAPLSASTKSYIHTFSGEGEILRLQETYIPKAQQEIFEQDSITTDNNGSAEILFFEGTSLRLDKNTHITIVDLTPEQGIFSEGGVQITLHQGRIWVQNFHSPNTHAALEIDTPNAEIFPIRANMDIEYRGGKEHIRVFGNSALIHVEGISLESEVLLNKNQEFFFTPFDTEVLTLDMSEKSSLWKIRNMNRDTQYKREYLQHITNKMKEQFVADELASQIHTFIAQNPSPQEMEKMIAKMNTLMDISDQEEIPEIREKIVKTEEQKKGNNNEKINQDNSKDNRKNESEDESEDKSIPEEINTQNFTVPAPKYISAQQKKTEYKTSVISEELIPDNISSEAVSEEEKGEIVIVLNPEFSEEIKTAKQVISEKRIEKFKKASQNFSDQINTLSFRDSRRNHAQNILNKIPNTPENIELLEIMLKDSPTDVQRYIQAKKIKIERSQN